MGKEIDKTKKVFKDGFNALSDYFDEKRSDTVIENEKIVIYLTYYFFIFLI